MYIETENFQFNVCTKSNEEIACYLINDGENSIYINFTHPSKTYITVDWADNPLEIALNVLKDTKYFYGIDPYFKEFMMDVFNDFDLSNYDWREFITETEKERIIELMEEV